VAADDQGSTAHEKRRTLSGSSAAGSVVSDDSNKRLIASDGTSLLIFYAWPDTDLDWTRVGTTLHSEFRPAFSRQSAVIDKRDQVPSAKL
jgi:hypothetical protein